MSTGSKAADAAMDDLGQKGLDVSPDTDRSSMEATA